MDDIQWALSQSKLGKSTMKESYKSNTILIDTAYTASHWYKQNMKIRILRRIIIIIII